jgi:hypothetical protein
MTILKSVLVAASLVALVATANAATRAELESGYHGNTPVQGSR